MQYCSNVDRGRHDNTIEYILRSMHVCVWVGLQFINSQKIDAALLSPCARVKARVHHATRVPLLRGVVITVRVGISCASTAKARMRSGRGCCVHLVLPKIRHVGCAGVCPAFRPGDNPIKLAPALNTPTTSTMYKYSEWLNMDHAILVA